MPFRNHEVNDILQEGYWLLASKSHICCAMIGEMISRIPNTDPLYESNLGQARANKNPMVYSHNHDNLRCHIQK